MIYFSIKKYTLFFQGSFGFTAEEGKKHLLLEINKFGDFKIYLFTVLEFIVLPPGEIQQTTIGITLSE